MSLGRMGGVYAILHASHIVTDHWGQSRYQAATKGRDDDEGRRACASHVLTLTTVQALTLAAGAFATGERLNPRRVVFGLAVNAGSHYWADRRFTLKLLAERCGKGELANLGDPKAAPCGTGAYALDQAWHLGWLAISAAVITGRKTP